MEFDSGMAVSVRCCRLPSVAAARGVSQTPYRSLPTRSSWPRIRTKLMARPCASGRRTCGVPRLTRSFGYALRLAPCSCIRAGATRLIRNTQAGSSGSATSRQEWFIRHFMPHPSLLRGRPKGRLTTLRVVDAGLAVAQANRTQGAAMTTRMV